MSSFGHYHHPALTVRPLAPSAIVNAAHRFEASPGNTPHGDISQKRAALFIPVAYIAFKFA